MTEDEMVGWHHQLNDMSLSKLWELVMVREVCCPWGHKELDMTKQPRQQKQRLPSGSGKSQHSSEWVPEPENSTRCRLCYNHPYHLRHASWKVLWL